MGLLDSCPPGAAADVYSKMDIRLPWRFIKPVSEMLYCKPCLWVHFHLCCSCLWSILDYASYEGARVCRGVGVCERTHYILKWHEKCINLAEEQQNHSVNQTWWSQSCVTCCIQKLNFLFSDAVRSTLAPCVNLHDAPSALSAFLLLLLRCGWSC